MNFKLIFNFLLIISSTLAYSCAELEEEIGEYISNCSEDNKVVTSL